MSVTYISKPGNVLLKLADEDAGHFFEMTRCAAEHYQVAMPLSATDDGVCWVDPDKFQCLVGLAFAEPHILLYTWVAYAVGVHERLTGIVCNGHWPQGQSPSVPLYTFRLWSTQGKGYSRKTFGHRG